MKIRPYSIDDKKAVILLLEQNTPQYFDHSEKEEYEKYLDSEIEDYFVIEQNNEIVGAGGINYFEQEKTARIAWDVISPNMQGQGLGRKLVEHRIDHIRDHGAIETIIVRTSQVAYQFYTKMGFNLTYTEKNFWAEGFDLYLMELHNKAT